MTDLATLAAADLVALDTDPANVLAVAFLTGFKSDNTRSAYGRDLREWFTYCTARGVRILDAKRADVDLYARTIEKQGASPATVARRLSTLAGFYGRAVEEDIMPKSPVQHVKRPKVSDESPLLGLDKAESKAFIDAARVGGPRDTAVACLLLLNGLRVSEVCAANISDLNTENGHRTLQVTRKGGRKQRRSLPPPTVAAIDEHVGDGTMGPLFTDKEGRRLDRHDVARIVRRLARAAGIEKQISPHSLRATFITQARLEGVPLEDVQDAAGHSDPRTTRRYDRARYSLDRDPSYALARRFAG